MLCFSGLAIVTLLLQKLDHIITEDVEEYDIQISFFCDIIELGCILLFFQLKKACLTFLVFKKEKKKITLIVIMFAL